MPHIIRTALTYLIFCHALIYSSSPAYRHELSRWGKVAVDGVHRLSFGYVGTSQSFLWRQQPESGLFQSTDMLHSVQQSMMYNSSKGLYTADGLVAYMSASDAVIGQGWKARVTLFMQLMAPRYTLLPSVHPSLRPQLQLLSLAAADLPAVGRSAKSEDPSIGYRLSCTSPSLHFGLGPQPVANCSVWPPAEPAPGTPAAIVAAAAALTRRPVAARATSTALPTAEAASYGSCIACPASIGLYRVMQDAICMCCATLWSNGSSSNSASALQDAAAAVLNKAAKQPLAVWTIVPSGYVQALQTTAAEAQKQLQQQQQQLPVLGGSGHYEAPVGSFVSFMQTLDTWFIFPRTPLVRLLPSMTGLQQLLFAYAVVSYTFRDLLHTITAVSNLQTRMRPNDPLGMHRGWSLGTTALSVTAQLLVMLVCRSIASMILAFSTIMLVYHMIRGIEILAVFMQLPNAKVIGMLMRLKTVVFGGNAAAVAAAGDAAAVPAAAAAAAAATLSSSSGVWALGKRLATMPVSVAASAAAATLGLDSASTEAALGSMRRALVPYAGYLLALHHFCEDMLLLVCARLVWELQEIVFHSVWEFLGYAAWEMQALLNAAATMFTMLVQGFSWNAALARFNQLQQMQQHRRAAAAAHGVPDDQNRVQAQVFIQAPADMGQAAEALRTLADELEQLGVHPLGLLAGFGAGRRRRVQQTLGQHWPAPLQLPFDVEQIQSELGTDVPRGFICPITQDIMKLPALLISSTVAVPATYDRDAIARWLQDNRRDPKSRQVLASDAQLVPNLDLYRAIEDWVAEKQTLLTQRAAAEQAEAQAADTAAAAARDRQEHQDAEQGPPAAVEDGLPAPQPSSSAGAVCSSLLAAVRGAAAAAVRRTRARSGGRRGRGSAAADQDQDDGPLLSDEEVEGPAVAAVAQEPAAAQHQAAGAASRSLRRYTLRRQPQQQQYLQQLDAGAVDVQQAVHPGGTAQVVHDQHAEFARHGVEQDGAQQRQQLGGLVNVEAGGSGGGRYNLRRNRSSTAGR